MKLRVWLKDETDPITYEGVDIQHGFNQHGLVISFELNGVDYFHFYKSELIVQIHGEKAQDEKKNTKVEKETATIGKPPKLQKAGKGLRN